MHALFLFLEGELPCYRCQVSLQNYFGVVLFCCFLCPQRSEHIYMMIPELTALFCNVLQCVCSAENSTGAINKIIFFGFVKKIWEHKQKLQCLLKMRYFLEMYVCCYTFLAKSYMISCYFATTILQTKMQVTCQNGCLIHLLKQ